jgi:hypothetical protein
MTHSGRLFIHLTRSIQGKPLCRLAGFERALNRYRVLVQGKIDRQFVGEDIHAASHGWLMRGLRRLAPGQATVTSAYDPKRTLDLLLKTEREKQPFTLKA